MKTWQGRFTGKSSKLFERFTSSIEQDRVLARYDLRVSRAHAATLARAGVISDGDAATIISALDVIATDLAEGRLEWRDELEDVHTHVESWLRERIGETADKLHAGRSRNDQIAADLRLFVGDEIQSILTRLLDLQDALLGLADRYRDDVLPGYTHLQQAQPVLIAYPLLAYVAMMERDWERFFEIQRRSDRSPLGSGAFAGSTLPLDRDVVATEAGFAAVIENSLDAVSDRDFLVEFVSAAALCMTHLSRLAEDFIIWSSVEFGFLKLPDSFASGSSMMPQKKNPDVLELIRGRTALVIGDAMASLTLVKGIPSSYNRDLQEDKTPLFHASTTLGACLEILAAMVPELEFDTDRCLNAVSSLAGATDLAEHLVRRGVPFRQAHAAVGAAVARCVLKGTNLEDIGIDDLELAAAPADIEPLPDLSARACVERKATIGSTGPSQVAGQISQFGARIQERRDGGGD